MTGGIGGTQNNSGGGGSYINANYGTQNISETATLMVGGAKDSNGQNGKAVLININD